MKDTTDYRIEFTLNLAHDNRRAPQEMPWAAAAGEPTDENAQRWRQAMNFSLRPSEVNGHISEKANILVQCGDVSIVSNKTGRVMATAKQPMFEVVGCYASPSTYIPVITERIN